MSNYVESDTEWNWNGNGLNCRELKGFIINLGLYFKLIRSYWVVLIKGIEWLDFIFN